VFSFKASPRGKEASNFALFSGVSSTPMNDCALSYKLAIAGPTPRVSFSRPHRSV
jgi:hypothetical protein